MLGRIQFSSKKFKAVLPKKKSSFRKPRHEKIYKWLASGLEEAGIKHKIIDLDRDKQGKKLKTQYGNTILVMMKTRYQIVCGWFPLNGHPLDRPDQGCWGIEIYKERGAWDRWLGRNRLNERDPLVSAIMGFLDSEEFGDVCFLKEKELKLHK